MIVADTNLVAYLFLGGDFTQDAEAVFDQDPDWVIPYLWRSEFRNVLTIYLRQGLLSLSEVQEIAQQAESFFLDREFAVNSLEVLQIAAVTNLSAYDCEFVALAQNLDISLVTSDRKIIKAYPQIATSPQAFTTKA